MKINFLLASLLIVIGLSTGDVITIPSTEFQALHDLYYSADGDHWIWHPTIPPYITQSKMHPVSPSSTYRVWNFSNPDANPCTENWYGITCLPYSAPSQYYHIDQLLLSKYNLNGSIPSSIAGLSSLTILDLRVNRLMGTIPASISSFTEIIIFTAADNLLVGPIPSSIGVLANLQQLDLHNNALSGPIPGSMGQLTALTSCLLNDNALSGSLPQDFGDHLQQLMYLTLTTNFITGWLPVSLGQMAWMLELSVDYNFLTGTIPDALCNCSFVERLYLQTNALTGNIPECLSDMYETVGLYLSSNRLTGTLPLSLCDLDYMRELFLYKNSFEGTIPDCIGTDMSSLQFIVLDGNALSGSIPASINALTRLQFLELTGNRLTGSLEGRFNGSTQVKLSTVLVNDNLLTGTLPTSLFDLPMLTILSASGNCFHGTLSDNVCALFYLQSLLLDGLSSGSACRTPIFPDLSTAYTVESSVSGTFPACIFQMFSLISLHLSGNGFTGTLPAYGVPFCGILAGCDDDFSAEASANGTVLPLRINPNLIDLSLSHNALTGSIPEVFQEHAWHKLDLSYNRLDGTLSSALATNLVNFSSNPSKRPFQSLVNRTVLSLQSNRISGRIPDSVRGLAEVSILGTNLFACREDTSDLPAHDPDLSNYQCASNAFDTPYYLWLGLTGAAALLVAGVWVCAAQGIRSKTVDLLLGKAQQWYRQVDCLPEQRKITQFTAVMGAISAISMSCGLFMLFVLVPLFAGLGSSYSMFTHSYAWTVSAAFLHGRTAFALVFVALLALLLWFIACCRRIFAAIEREPTKVDEFRSSGTHRSDAPLSMLTRTQYALTFAGFSAINALVVTDVYVAYVYVAIYESSQLLAATQVLLSLFKIFWSNVAVDKILYHLANGVVTWVNRLSGTRPQPTLSLQQLNEVFEPLQFFTDLLNSIAIPCVVVLGVSPRCFYNAFVQSPSVSTTYQTNTCIYDIRKRDGYECTRELVESSYDPPFTYSYQCSSSLVTYYAPAFVNLCLVGMFVTPAVELGQTLLHRWARRGTKLHALLDEIAPPLWKPLPPNTAATTAAAREATEEAAETAFPSYSTSSDAHSAPVQPAMEVVKPYESANKPLFDPSRLLYSLLSNLALLLTFGVVFPPLGVALVATIVVSVWFARVKLGRFLLEATEQQQLHLVAKIERECEGVGSAHMLSSAVWVLVTLSCWFYTLFLFDTLGDEVGFEGAYWMLIVMPLMPLVLYAFWASYIAISQQFALLVPKRRRSVHDEVGGKVVAFELNPLGKRGDQEA